MGLWQKYQPEMVIWQRVQHGNGHSLPNNQQQRDSDIVVALVVIELRVAFQNGQNDVYQLLLEHGPLWWRHTWGRANESVHGATLNRISNGESRWFSLTQTAAVILFFDFQFGKKEKTQNKSTIQVCHILNNQTTKTNSCNKQNKNSSWAKLETSLASGFVTFPHNGGLLLWDT